jgi:hypothetical protein
MQLDATTDHKNTALHKTPSSQQPAASSQQEKEKKAARQK